MTTASIVLAGCGGGNDLDGIEVSKSGTPKVKVEKDYTTEKTEAKVVSKGGGDEIKSGDTIKLNYVAVNGRTGKEFDNSFKNETPMTLTLNEKTALPGFYKGLVGQDIGSRVVVSVPSKDGASLLQSVESLGLEKDDTMVFVFDLVSKIPPKAEGKAVKAPASLPKLTYDKDQQPAKFVKTKKTAAKLGKSGSYVLIKGEGDKVEKGATVTIQYVGQKYPAGDVFDASWASGPRQISLAEGNAVGCFTDQVPGNTLGSRIVVTCTTDDAYGKDAKKNGQPEGPLIFVVDLLDAS
ncbi:FKBP-type peptidyl-prolyl cis-trans isomerase [Aeromicrobium duanguangcaii]|uniref:Peptidyl-prolyl cis-trans isomerase n=1 Tax=Aeromicrobium duanguangcaii TaxID=2968086 RepID=A0ABY5KAZ0_9ACTN|nr:FKBP-type peptidyl-prolyl cis-trans isomerase [Aeromicrobium duanguangcaii]MCD9152807.1 FKBP-type peptidyl-prolyl cis-trans isomerase [Aeromicrobium duanguangcaii]MCL3837191.1 FKBP-type peptidyl-prolyl cis-trans isomerase [Aeromicrobium duanguangcaii]UUI67213.1 FKBP-type peptidyl-prolyl cis-trans isomerase [Aeromicrobium duanguangcaii]